MVESQQGVQYGGQEWSSKVKIQIWESISRSLNSKLKVNN